MEKVVRVCPRHLVRVLCLSGLLILATGAWSAAADEVPSVHGVHIAELKQAALELRLRMLRATEPPPEPGSSLLYVYVGPGESGSVLDLVSLAIDDQRALVRRFDERESAALDGEAVYRMPPVELAPGEHRLRLQIAVHRSGVADAAAGSTTLELHRTLALPPGASEIELSPVGGNWLGSRELQLRRLVRMDLAEESRWSLHGLFSSVIGDESGELRFLAGDSVDPVVRYAHYLAAHGEFLEAAARLGQLCAGVPRATPVPSCYAEQARVYLKYGLPEAANTAAAPVLKEDVQPDLAQELRFDLAQGYLEHGEYDKALEVLGSRPPRTKRRNLSRWQDLKARILIAGDHLRDAGEVIGETFNTTDFDSYVRYYNFAMALIADGRVDQGLTVLERIGRVRGTYSDMRALSDRANLVLGSYFVRQSLGATAIPILGRIRSAGPYSNRALLDLGWAWLAPAGTVQQRSTIGDERTVGPPPESVGALTASGSDQNLYQRYHLGPFARAKVSEEQEERVKRALAVWSLLLDRDPQDEAVQESLLAIAYGLDQIGANQEAVEYYEKAMTALSTSLDALDKAADYVSTEQWLQDLVGEPAGAGRFDRTLHALPAPALAAHLADSLAGRDFQGWLSDYRDLQAISGALSAWGTQASTATAPTSASAPTRDSGEVIDDTENLAATGTAPSCTPLDCGASDSSIAYLQKLIAAAEAQLRDRIREKLGHDLKDKIDERQHLLKLTTFQLARKYDAGLADSQ